MSRAEVGALLVVLVLAIAIPAITMEDDAPREAHRTAVERHARQKHQRAADAEAAAERRAADKPAERPCKAAELDLRIHGGQAGYAGSSGTYDEGFLITNRGDEACQLQGVAVVTMDNPSWPSDLISGNPARVPFDVRLDPRTDLAAGALWSNWCRDHDKWQLTVEVLGTARTTNSGAPVCTNPDEASVLDPYDDG